MEFSQPPPLVDVMQPTPPPIVAPHFNPNFNHNFRPHFNHHHGGGPRPFFRPFQNFHHRHHSHHGMTQDDFDGKRLRKSVMRKTVDYNSSIIKALQVGLFIIYIIELLLKSLILLFRTEYGNEIIVTVVHYNQKQFMHLILCHRRVISKIQPMQLQPDSSKQQQTKCDVQFSHLHGLQKVVVL